MVHALFSVADYLLWIVSLIVIVQVVISWLLAFNVLNTRSDGVRAFAVALERITAPIYRPIRAMLPDFGGLDFSPLVILVLIQIARMLLAGADASVAASGA